MLSQNDIKTYSLMTYFNAGYMAEPLGMSLCHSVLALSLYVRGISVITLLPLGKGGGAQLVSQALLLILSFLYRVPTIILLIFFLFSFFLFNFVPITKGIRTINKKDSANEASTELTNTVFVV